MLLLGVFFLKVAGNVVEGVGSPDDAYSYGTWLQSCFDVLSQSRLEKIVMVSWSIWRARIMLVWNLEYGWRGKAYSIIFCLISGMLL